MPFIDVGGCVDDVRDDDVGGCVDDVRDDDVDGCVDDVRDVGVCVELALSVETGKAFTVINPSRVQLHSTNTALFCEMT